MVSNTHVDSFLGLNLGKGDLSMVDHYGVTLGSTRGWVGPSNTLGELRIWIREEQLIREVSYKLLVSLFFGRYRQTYDIIPLDVVSLAPRTHYKWIIKCRHSHNIHSLFLQGRQVLDIARKMVDRAGRSESTRYGEQYNFLIGPFFRGIVWNWNSASRNFARLGSPWDISTEKSLSFLHE